MLALIAFFQQTLAWSVGFTGYVMQKLVFVDL